MPDFLEKRAQRDGSVERVKEATDDAMAEGNWKTKATTNSFGNCKRLSFILFQTKTLFFLFFRFSTRPNAARDLLIWHRLQHSDERLDRV
ncbi:hypothetical protein HYV43_06245 [Candidatus Micrarchaeota archaeon]|nr:hypothetical protein [Candidatus Micrarchaeota archaeon]